ncbi:MAG TPA: 50S ribosomal protein P1 [Nanoarchaeota archaeon]|nr:50S ribosomal protein P1 [Nanoarchaeota archaeon]
MEYIYAGMLLHKAGKQITEAAVKKVLEAAGVAVDEGRTKALVAALEGVDIDAAIKEAAVCAAPVAAASAAAAPAEKKEAKKEEEKKVTEEQAAAGLGALFG